MIPAALDTRHQWRAESADFCVLTQLMRLVRLMAGDGFGRPDHPVAASWRTTM